jgi:hypothetical protein
LPICTNVYSATLGDVPANFAEAREISESPFTGFPLICANFSMTLRGVDRLQGPFPGRTRRCVFIAGSLPSPISERQRPPRASDGRSARHATDRRAILVGRAHLRDAGEMRARHISRPFAHTKFSDDSARSAVQSVRARGLASRVGGLKMLRPIRSNSALQSESSQNSKRR